MPTKQPLFRKDASVPGGYLISVTGALLLSAGAAYGPADECTPEGRARGLRVVKRILSAATKAGFTQSGIFETLLARNEVTQRVKDLACEAVDTIGHHEAARIIAEVMNEDDSND